MSNPIDVKALARNSMLEKLQSKIKKQNIQVQAYEGEDDEDEEDMCETGYAAPDKEAAHLVKASALLNEDHLFAVVAIGDDLVGGTVATVEAELERIQPESYEIKIITSDEQAAKALFKPKAEAEVVTAEPQTDEVGSFYVITDTVTADSELHDICFKADVLRMMLQAKGGLEQNQVLGIYKDKATAVAKARELLKAAGSPHVDQDDSVVDQ
jgi:hypothetical protein